jgi:hypothetical protein
MTEEPPTDIESYIRANRDRFTHEALAARLVEAGHDPAAVEAALAAVDAEGEGADAGAAWITPAELDEAFDEVPGDPVADASASPPRSGVVGVLSGLLILVAFLGYGGAVLLGLAGAALEAGGGLFFPGGPIATIWLLLYSVAMLLGGIYSVRRLARAPSASSAGRAMLVALSISVAIFGGLSGICQVGLANMRV